MPIYVYELDPGDPDDNERFEFLQKMDDPPLTRHPETGQPIRRIVAAPSVPAKGRPQSTKEMLSDKNLDRLGFTKYVKEEGGYKKAIGSGPDSIARPD